MKTINPKSLEKLEAVLTNAKEPLTLKALGKKLRCSRDATIRRLDAFIEKHKGFFKVKKVYVREGKRGPESEAFYL